MLVASDKGIRSEFLQSCLSSWWPAVVRSSVIHDPEKFPQHGTLDQPRSALNGTSIRVLGSGAARPVRCAGVLPCAHIAAARRGGGRRRPARRRCSFGCGVGGVAGRCPAAAAEKSWMTWDLIVALMREFPSAVRRRADTRTSRRSCRSIRPLAPARTVSRTERSSSYLASSKRG